MSHRPLLATITGEHFQPVRLHYRVLDQKGLLSAFKRLRCVDHDAPRRRWVWLYDHEAKNLQFQKSHAQIPAHLHPIVIGSFFLRTKDKLLLDLRSCDRATAAIVFFDKHLPRNVAKVTGAEVVNKLFCAADNPNLAPHDIFDHQESTFFRDPAGEVQRLIDLTAQVQDPQDKLRIAQEDLESRAKRPLPEIERLPVHFYEDGIQGFVSALRMRQVVALQHWLGNTEYTLFDVIQSAVKAM